jgi:hypothetical protein
LFLSAMAPFPLLKGKIAPVTSSVILAPSDGSTLL